MGLFDTFILDQPIICEKCKNKIKTIQSKSFGCSLDIFRPGEIIQGSPFYHGIVEEDAYCETCRNHSDQMVNIIIWHNIYVGVLKDKNEALSLLDNIDRLNLIDWLKLYQDERRELANKFNKFYHSIEMLNEYLAIDDKNEISEQQKLLRYSHIIEYVDLKNPIKEILKEYKNDLKKYSVDIFEEP